MAASLLFATACSGSTGNTEATPTDSSGFTRQGFLDAITEGSDYELVDYKLSDITAKLDGESVVSEPSPSLVTFVRVDGQWKVASEAFFSM